MYVLKMFIVDDSAVGFWSVDGEGERHRARQRPCAEMAIFDDLLG